MAVGSIGIVFIAIIVVALAMAWARRGQHRPRRGLAVVGAIVASAFVGLFVVRSEVRPRSVSLRLPTMAPSAAPGTYFNSGGQPGSVVAEATSSDGATAYVSLGPSNAPGTWLYPNDIPPLATQDERDLVNRADLPVRFLNDRFVVAGRAMVVPEHPESTASAAVEAELAEAVDLALAAKLTSFFSDMLTGRAAYDDRMASLRDALLTIDELQRSELARRVVQNNARVVERRDIQTGHGRFRATELAIDPSALLAEIRNRPAGSATAGMPLVLKIALALAAVIVAALVLQAVVRRHRGPAGADGHLA